MRSPPRRRSTASPPTPANAPLPSPAVPHFPSATLTTSVLGAEQPIARAAAATHASRSGQASPFVPDHYHLPDSHRATPPRAPATDITTSSNAALDLFHTQPEAAPFRALTAHPQPHQRWRHLSPLRRRNTTPRHYGAPLTLTPRHSGSPTDQSPPLPKNDRRSRTVIPVSFSIVRPTTLNPPFPAGPRPLSPQRTRHPPPPLLHSHYSTSSAHVPFRVC